MKNIVNNSAPFFNKYGQILSFGRMAIVAPNTDDEYLDVKNSDGTPLSNPIELSIYGRPPESVYVNDGVSYDVVLYQKLTDDRYMFVDRYYVDSNSNSGGSPVSSITSVGNVEALRNVDTAEGKVLVLGYSSAGDYCPPRVFTWNVGSYEDNAGTIIKSQKNDSGAWILNESDIIDIRFFGVNPESDSKESEISAFSRAVGYSSGKSLYFPKGDYYFGNNFSFKDCCVVMEKGCIFHPTTGRNVEITVYYIENRGGYFAEGACPKAYGVLRTSLYRGDTAQYLSIENILEYVDKVIVDYFKTSSSTALLNNKFVVLEIENPSTLNFENCKIFNEVTGEYEIQKGTKTVSVSEDGINITGQGGKTLISLSKITTNGELILNGFSAFNESVHLNGDSRIQDCSLLNVTGRGIFNEIVIPYSTDFPENKKKGDLVFVDNGSVIGLFIYNGTNWFNVSAGR